MSQARIITSDLAFVDDDWASDAGIVVDDDVIVDAGTKDWLEGRYPNLAHAHLSDSILVPGGVNGHGHTFQALVRGFGDDIPFIEWMGSVVHPTAASLDAMSLRVAALYDLGEMLRMGITTAVEYFYLHDGSNDNAWHIIEAAREIGLRLVFARCMFDADPGPKRYQESPSLYERNFRELRRDTDDDPRVHVQPAPHSVLGASSDMLRLAADLAQEFDTPFHVHTADSQGEVDVSLERYGLTPVGRLREVGALGPHTLAVHAVRVNTEDLDAMAESGAGVVHNPSTNAFLAGGISPVADMRSRGIPVCLGTDAGGANSRQSLWEEMRMAALLSKAVTRDARSLTAIDVLRMGTSSGGRLLRLPVGRLSPGYYADWVVLDTHSLSMRPRKTVTQNIIYSMLPDAISSVVVGGKELVRNGEVLTVDSLKVADEVDRVTSSWTPLSGSHPDLPLH